jgi:hypothetical protein
MFREIYNLKNSRYFWVPPRILVHLLTTIIPVSELDMILTNLHHIISFIFILWIHIGLRNPHGYGNSQICLHTYLFATKYNFTKSIQNKRLTGQGIKHTTNTLFPRELSRVLFELLGF